MTEPIIPDSWTDAENFVWNQVKQGSIADFNIKEESDPPLDPSSETGWSVSRKLSSKFLHTILLEKEYQDLIKHRGVVLIGAWFPEPVNLSSASINHILELQQCRFDQPVEFRRLKSSKYISLRGSSFSGLLNMNGMQVESSLFMDEKASFTEVKLVRAKIGGQVSMNSSSFSGLLDMNSTLIESSLFMNEKAEFGKVDLTNAQIKGQVYMQGSTFSGLLDMNSMQVEKSLFIDKGCFFTEVDFSLVRISRNMYMRNSNFSNKPVLGLFSHIGGILDIRGCKLNSLNLSGAVVTGEFHFGEWDEVFTSWEAGAELRLVNTKVGALQDHPDEGSRTSIWKKLLKMVGALQDHPDEGSRPSVWPEFLELDGFTYERLGGFSKDSSNDMFKGRTDWYINKWLKKQKPYSPQPYVQLAEVMKRQGHKDSANQILYAAKEREREESPLPSWRRFALRLEKFIGYGYRFRNAFYTLAFLIVFGMYILHYNEQGTKLRPQKDACTTTQNLDFCAAEETAKVIVAEFFYSVDKLIPLLKLGVDVPKDSPQINDDEFVRMYFYLHGIIGYVLGALIASWLAGLMKP